MFTLFDPSENDKRMRQEELIKVNRLIYDIINDQILQHREEFIKAKKEAGYDDKKIESELKKIQDNMQQKGLELYYNMLVEAARQEKEKNKFAIEPENNNLSKP